MCNFLYYNEDEGYRYLTKSAGLENINIIAVVSFIYEENGAPRENRRLVTSRWQTFLHTLFQ